jgi:hypothetical protein
MNTKKFLVADSIQSMAAIHVKIHEDKNEYQFRIADCNRTVKIWGNTHNRECLQEGIDKMTSIIEMAEIMKAELENRLKLLTPGEIK